MLIMYIHVCVILLRRSSTHGELGWSLAQKCPHLRDSFRCHFRDVYQVIQAQNRTRGRRSRHIIYSETAETYRDSYIYKYTL